MLKKLSLLIAPLLLVGCSSSNNPAANANYIKLNSYQISGGGTVSKSEPVYYVFAEYELTETITDSHYSNYVYGDSKKTIYVMGSFESYEKYGFKKEATVNIYDYNTGNSSTTTATHKGDIVKVKNETQLFYAVEIRTLKNVQYNFASEKVFNNSKLNDLKDKYYFSASLTNEATVISLSSYGYSSVFRQSTVETYIDLGTTAVSYVPYTAPEK